MSLSAISFLYDIPGLSKLIFHPKNGEENKPVHGGIKVIKETSQFNVKIESRPIRNYLTLGIPLFIEKCSLLWQEVIHRKQIGNSLSFHYKTKDFSPYQINLIKNFHQFNEVSLTPLNNPEFHKICSYINHAINRRDHALANSDLKIVEQCDRWLDKFKSILKKSLVPQATRNDFNQNDWEVLDLVDYELAYEHFSNLTKIFNIWGSKIRKMESHFKVDLNEALIAEGLALSLAYIEGLNGKKIFLPVASSDEKLPYKSVEYSIIEVTLGDALPSYILESSDKNAPPWFVIRGTQPCTGKDQNGKEFRSGSLESLLADAIDPKEIAKDVIKKSLVYRPIVKQNGRLKQKKSLFEVFEGWKKKKMQVILAGHSLGGCLVNHLAVRYDKIVKNAYGFSPAGVSKKIAAKWEKKLNKASEESEEKRIQLENKIVNFDYEGDFVPAGGAKIIGLHLAVTPLVDRQEHGLYHRHIKCHLNQSFKVCKVDIEAENRKISRKLCEKVRNIFGGCFRLLLNLFSKKSIPDWWKNRKIYRKKANALDKAIKAFR